MGKLGENQRNNHYGIKYDKYDGILKHIKSASTDDVLKTIQDLKSRQTNKYSQFSDKSMRLLGEVPADLYMYFHKKFPGFWNNKKNVREFFKIHKQFRVADKI